ncbi:MAG: hypothetical protein LKE33_07515 [Acidaminococcus sp.]|nr:hypothetical protein [Acidaminococcus sp.]MCI2100798.1 hypothetical protein [Acidaminococcus sp.]MCI2115157.1 hypothetical protein [Acidaminococcus sp.]MCI2117232.1 hypothetical protein [Acidaminococcus sp.]
MGKTWTMEAVVDLIDAAIMGALREVYEKREDCVYDVLWDKETHNLWTEKRKADEIDDKGGTVMSVYTVMEYPENLEPIEYDLKKSGAADGLSKEDLENEVLARAFGRYISHGYRNEFARKIVENIN